MCICIVRQYINNYEDRKGNQLLGIFRPYRLQLGIFIYLFIFFELLHSKSNDILVTLKLFFNEFHWQIILTEKVGAASRNIKNASKQQLLQTHKAKCYECSFQTIIFMQKLISSLRKNG